MAITITLNQTAIRNALGNAARFSAEFGGKELTESGITFTDAEYMNLPAEDITDLKALKAKNFIIVKSEGVVVTNLDDLQSVEGLAKAFEVLNMVVGSASAFTIKSYVEEVTIAVGAGMAGVATSIDMVKANSFLLGSIVKVITAPGGGATTLDAGRTTIAADELAAAIAVAANTVANSWEHATPVGFVHNLADDTITLTTDANVTVSAMVVEVMTIVAELTN